jgi:hypothetical protein
MWAWVQRLSLINSQAHRAGNLGAVTDPTGSQVEIDLDAIGKDLEDVEAALARLDAGTYWTDEITGDPLDEAVLNSDPLARSNPATPHQLAPHSPAPHEQ